MSIDSIVFDLDGVIIDTENVWNTVRYEFATAHGGYWDTERDQPLVMGANSMQWAASMRENNGVDLSNQEIYAGIISGLRRRYAQHLPLIPKAVDVVIGLARYYRLGVASSSPLEIIEYVLELSGLQACFDALVSSDEVSAGKPEPHVYLEACARLATEPERAVAVEDSTSGIQAAHSAGLVVVAIPNAAFPPSAEVLASADVVLDSIVELDRTLIASLGEQKEGRGGR